MVSESSVEREEDETTQQFGGEKAFFQEPQEDNASSEDGTHGRRDAPQHTIRLLLW